MNAYSGQFSSALSPASPQAHAISVLVIGVIIMASVVALVVAGLVAWVLIHFTRRAGFVPIQNEGNRTAEIIYTVIPLTMMAGLFVCTVVTMRRAEPATTEPVDLVIIAHGGYNMPAYTYNMTADDLNALLAFLETRKGGSGFAAHSEFHVP